jgi:hypothetical protein
MGPHMNLNFIALTLAIAAVTSVACTPVAASRPIADSVAMRASMVSLAIMTPRVDRPVRAGPVTVSVDYSGPPLVPAGRAESLADYHLHYFLDIDPTPYLGTNQPIPLGNPHIIHTADTEVTFDAVGPGLHTVAVVLTASNHVSLDPPVASIVMFTVVS